MEKQMALRTVTRAEETDVLSAQTTARPCVRGKFLFVGGQKFFVKGVTYGAFRPDGSGVEFHDRSIIERDFAMMARNGINTVRIPHTTPPVHLLDIAARHGLQVMVGLSAEQYVGYLLDHKEPPNLDSELRSKVRSCAGHPALLCYALGNEIPAGVARWLGRGRIEEYLHEIYLTVMEGDPEGLVTYVNYPTTEYLHLPFLDLLCFNVYLERQDRLAAYLARLQNIAGDRPVVMSELGLDSMRNGTVTQAEVLDWQIRTTFQAGCAGAVIFSWTDEWFRGGADVSDWEFGLTDGTRRPKPNLGLSSARNLGCQNARGDFVAYIDDDAYPDPDWLNYYLDAFQSTGHALIGGPNLPPVDDPPIAQCVARAPGGPTHVLLSDTIAEHVPGCNMMFRKDCLESIGGFDPTFRVAGDDVDVCWRIQERGWTVGFAPAAVVWHHRRPSVRAYLKQQFGYGRSEALLTAEMAKSI
jgi:hypothetical protein